MIENVVGLLHGDSFSGLCEALAALDLHFGAMVINADRFLPQSRPRVFLVAVRNDLDLDGLAGSEPIASTWIPTRVHAARTQLRPDLQARWRWWTLPEPTGAIEAVEDLIEDHPDGVEWNSSEVTDRLLAMMSPANLAKIAAAKQAGTPRVGFFYRRTRAGRQRAEVRFDGVAGCLRTPYGGSSRQTVVVVNGESVRSRLLSAREAARLMGVGDSYQLLPGYNDSYRAMGDAVAVPAVAWLSDNLLLPLVERARRTQHAAAPAVEESLADYRVAAELLASQWHASAQPEIIRR